MAQKRAAGEKLDLTKWQHDLFRINGKPYDEEEIEVIKYFSAKADEKFEKTGSCRTF